MSRFFFLALLKNQWALELIPDGSGSSILIIVLLCGSSSLVFLPSEQETVSIPEIRGFNLVFIPVRLRSGQAVSIRGFTFLAVAKGCAGLILRLRSEPAPFGFAQGRL